MKRSTIRIIIIFSSFLLLSLICTQIYWVKKAYDIEQKQFENDVTSALKNVVKVIQENSEDSIPIWDPIDQLKSNFFVVRLNDTPYPFFLKSLLKSEFKKSEINESFEFNIYDCFSDKVVFQQKIQAKRQQEAKANIPSIKWHEDEGHYFSILFPNRVESIWSKMNFWIYSSIIIVITSFFFTYIISVILKQRKINEIKTDFINNMTHEFKTPISTISLSSKVLLKPNITEQPERLKNYAQIIYNENQRLQNQVERLLQIATIEKENVKLKKTSVDLHQIITKSADTFGLNIEAKGGKITLDLAASEHIIQGDEVHLTNIICNLIDNAIKYGDKTPLISVITKNLKEGISISVKDNGPGIPKEEQKNIFEKFYRIPTGNRHDIKGFGIGLNYVKVMIEQHHGLIKLKSEPGKGTEFIIKLPFK